MVISIDVWRCNIARTIASTKSSISFVYFQRYYFIYMHNLDFQTPGESSERQLRIRKITLGSLFSRGSQLLSYKKFIVRLNSRRRFFGNFAGIKLKIKRSPRQHGSFERAKLRQFSRSSEETTVFEIYSVHYI